MADNLIGLHLGDNLIRVSDATLSNGQIEIASIGFQEEALPIFTNESENILLEEAKKIDNLITALKIKKKNVDIVIPDGYTFSQIIEMPRLKEKELLSAIKYQADQFIPMPLEKTALDLQIIYEEPKEKKVLVLVVASAEVLIARITKLAELSGFIPEIIENELSATGRLILQVFNKIESANGYVFLNFGYNTSSLYFFHPRKKLITEVYNFKIGLSLFIKEAEIVTNFNFKKTKDIITTIGFSKNASIDLGRILKPAISELSKNMKTFFNLIKDKYNIEKVDGIFLLNQAYLLGKLSKKIEEIFSIPTRLFPMESIVKKNQASESFAGKMSSYLTVLGANIK